MSKNSIIDYSGYILLRIIGPLVRCLPVRASLFLGAGLGGLFYYLDLKHRAVAYSNIKTAFGAKMGPRELSRLTKRFYHLLGQNLIEILLIPLVDKGYLEKYIAIEGKENVSGAFGRGKGAVIVGVHEGSWELSNVICANLGFPFNLFIRGQGFPRLNGLLNSYRAQKGCKLIERRNETRGLIRALKNNEAIGMTADQGGKSGTLVKFFGKYASMPSGAIRLALKYDCAVIPAFYTRVKGPYLKVFGEAPLKITRSGDFEKDLNDNLQALTNVFEKYISRYPQEYLWSYKIWKYTSEKNILIISDGKTGHLRQSEALCAIAADCLKDSAKTVNVKTVEVKFKSKFSRSALAASSLMAGKYSCQGCLWCLKSFLDEESYRSLISVKPDIVISCGSSVAPVNYVISRENSAKSIAIMRPALLGKNKFDLMVMSRHDRPAKGKKVAVIEGALNLINADYLKTQGAALKSRGVKLDKIPVLGILLGGDTKGFQLSGDLVRGVNSQVKAAMDKLDGEILITTSRRTPVQAESLIKEEFLSHARCKLMVIASENNIPEAVGGILALSAIVIVSPESISMISEAASSGKYVIVFDSAGLSKKHREFLDHLAKNKYIYFSKPRDLSANIQKIWLEKPAVRALSDDLVVREAIKKIL
ncbi:MAG: ELM1/GtrOC1 family putative glycosyltransferase [Candidatus Omnitrophica bacterium]|nr:ELM1/GtrOC1 family putative glycosyltransferase [Candidatus Omnitrophota bacterium]MDD5552400.1 ELM1/GtrOC1 family putative glycosyltransferase [Candidatus Omnitrophota bacterium]